MTFTTKSRIQNLGQTGLKIDIADLTVVIDPYLSNSVQELVSADLVRQVPILYEPHTLTDVDWILITHDHMDHCDPHTLPVLAMASPNAKFIAPLPVRLKLVQWGIPPHRIFVASTDYMHLGAGLSVKAVPSSHPIISLDYSGNPQCVGYFFKSTEHNLYVAGDTSLCDSLISALDNLGPIESAFLPVNEDNYFRRKKGIIGNMSIREAFGLAKQLGIKHVVPVHWDLFVANSVLPDEISAVYDGYDWGFTIKTADQIVL